MGKFKDIIKNSNINMSKYLYRKPYSDSLLRILVDVKDDDISVMQEMMKKLDAAVSYWRAIRYVSGKNISTNPGFESMTGKKYMITFNVNFAGSASGNIELRKVLEMLETFVVEGSPYSSRSGKRAVEVIENISSVKWMEAR